MLWQVYGPDPMSRLLAMTSTVGLAALVSTPRTGTLVMLGEAKVPTQVSSAADWMLVPAMFLPVTPLFQVLAPQADQTWPGSMVMPPKKSSVNGPLALRLRSRVNSSMTFRLATLASDVAWN